MKELLLDLSEAKLPDWWPSDTPKQIAVQKGEHQKEFDLTPEQMLTPWAKKMVGILTARGAKRGGLYSTWMPIGFNRNEIPAGGKLVKKS